MKLRSVTPTLISLALASAPVAAQEGGDLIDVDVGSSRIGGPGATKSERAMVRSWDEPEEYITEENLPKEGSKKRMPALHVLAKRSADGKDWETACRWFDQIQDEGGDEAMDVHPDAKKNAWRSYLGCAERLASTGKHDQAERMLKKSEQWGPSDFRQEKVRRDILRDQYHQKVSGEDFHGAMEIFEKYQAIKEDENERIWLGDVIVKKAVEANELGDEATRDDLMKLAKRVSPTHPDLRAIEEEIEFQENVGKNIALIAGFALVIVIAGTRLNKWRARKKVEAAAGGKLGKKNKFLDDDDL